MLSWPAKELWPNGSHGNYHAVSRARKAARTEADWATRYVKPHGWKHDGGPISIHIRAHPKTANAVDAQNVIAGLKAHFDGIADALGVDDKCFAAPTLTFAEPCKGGAIIVEVGA